MASRILSRLSRSSITRSFSSGFRSLSEPRTISSSKWVCTPTNQSLRCSLLTNGTFGRYGFSSSASPEPNDKESNQSVEQDTESTKSSGDSTAPEQTQDADVEPDLSFDDLAKLVAEKDELLKLKQKELEKMQDKVLRTYAEMENVMDRTKREAENSKKFAIQNFAKNLLDVADNLGRASSVVKESFSKIDESKDSVGAVPLLKTLLEGVEMTNKQLSEVFRKFGVEKFDPVDELFDPNRHHAVFQIPDPSKPSGTVAAVLKSGYMLHDRVLRPAEVGVTEAADNASDQSQDA
ncbi:uncharacterized protein M6B38_369830 [Iris pallida]|uniref:GrpE protein homolog n=1 Tax=Iris pallida TaxID=29817 RepID=A0AAX6GF20_IRIPA|nr:uncharacterized protein M6B38_369830 [Iris pallida]